MNYSYEIQLAGRTITIAPDIWRKISEYVNNGQWFYVVYMNKTYKYFRTHSFYDRPAIYMFTLVDEVANEQIKYIFL